MNKIDRVRAIIFCAIDSVNEQVPEDKRIGKGSDVVLFGRGGRLDSLGIINLIIATEQKIEEEFGLTLTLANEEAMSLDRSPFKTIESLTHYILQRLSENGIAQ